MGVADDETHPAQPAGFERAQERVPECFGFGVADVNAEDLTAALGAHAGGDDDRSGHDLAEGVVADVDIDRIQIHVRELGVTQRRVPERSHTLVEPGTDPRHLGLRDPAGGAHRLHQRVHRSSRHPRHVRLHHNRVQRLVDPPARFQNAQKERDLAQLRDRQLQITGLRGERAGAVTVAFGHPPLGSFIRAGTDHLGVLSFDQLVRQPLSQLTHKINGAIARAQRSDKFGQGRLIQSHRCVLLSSFLQEHTKDHADGSPAGGPTKPHQSTGLYPGQRYVPLQQAFAAMFGRRLHAEHTWQQFGTVAAPLAEGISIRAAVSAQVDGIERPTDHQTDDTGWTLFVIEFEGLVRQFTEDDGDSTSRVELG